MGNANDVKAGGAYVKIGGDDTELQKALNRAAAKFKALGSVVSAAGRQMLTLGASIVAPLALASRAFANTGSDLFRMSQRTGIGVEALSALGYAAQQSGIDMETLEGGIRKMQKSIVENTKPAQEAFARLGITIADLAGLSPDKQFEAIAEAMAKIKDPTVQAGTAMEIFGKSGTTMIPLLMQGAKGMQMAEERARALGIVMSTDAAKGAVALKGRIADLTDVIKNSFFRTGEALAPMIQRFVEISTRAGIAINQWVSANKDLVQTVLKIGVGVTVAGAAMLVLGKSIGVVGWAMKGISTIASSFSVIPPLIMAIASPVGLVVAGLGALAGYLLYTTQTGQATLRALGGYFGDLKDTAMETFNGVRDALAAGEWALAAQVAWAGLKLAWAQGIQPLKVMWVGIKTFAMETWANIGDGILSATYRMIGALKNAWATFKAWFSNTMRGAEDAAVGLWISAQEKMGKITPKEAQAQRDQLSQLHKQGNANDNSERDADIRRTNKETKERLDAVKQIHDAEIRRINAVSKEDIEAAQANLDAKRKALDDLAKAAKDKANDPKNRFGGLPALPPLPPGKLPNGADLDSIMQKVRTAGTFSSAAAFGLAGSGGNNVAQKQLEEAKKLVSAVIKAGADTVDIIKKVFPFRFG